MGRPYLGAGEITRITTVEEVISLYHEQQKAENPEVWAQLNPWGYELLNAAMGAYIRRLKDHA